jgi:hypothetical protein
MYLCCQPAAKGTGAAEVIHRARKKYEISALLPFDSLVAPAYTPRPRRHAGDELAVGEVFEKWQKH